MEPAGGADRRAAHTSSAGGRFLPGATGEVQLPGELRRRRQRDKHRISDAEPGVVLAANATLGLLYRDIGRVILERQQRAGWWAPMGRRPPVPRPACRIKASDQIDPLADRMGITAKCGQAAAGRSDREWVEIRARSVKRKTPRGFPGHNPCNFVCEPRNLPAESATAADLWAEPYHRAPARLSQRADRLPGTTHDHQIVRW